MLFKFRDRSRSGRAPDAPRYLTIDGPDGPIPVEIRSHATARRMILRLSPRGEGALVTVPAGLGERQVRAFVESRTGWIAKRMREAVPTVAAGHGAVIPVRDVVHAIVHRPEGRGAVRRSVTGETPALIVPGPAETLDRKLRDWLKRQARADLETAVRAHAENLGVQAGRITVRDTRSRWGSCTGTGNLNFSWRLVMAPPFVLGYVAAHEVAHLKEMNHGPRFWSILKDLDPQTDRAERWLKTDGPALHRILPNAG